MLHNCNFNAFLVIFPWSDICEVNLQPTEGYLKCTPKDYNWNMGRTLEGTYMIHLHTDTGMIMSEGVMVNSIGGFQI